MKKCFLLTIVIFLKTFTSSAQAGHDSTFYQSYKGSIITRIYFSKKYDIFKMTPPNGNPTAMSYHANTALSLGLGLTYRSLSFSFSKELSFLKSEEKKGVTNATDLQLHLYKQKWTIDALGEFYKGYYLRPDGLAAPDGQSFYLRPDLGVQLVGLAVH